MRRLAAPAFFIAALAVAANLNALAAGFVWDDRALIIGNALIRRLQNIPDFFREPFLGLYYRPVVMASFAVEYALWGLRPLGYHATNVALHAANSVLVYCVFAWAFRARGAALVTALLFASHPAHKGVVAIADRTGILAGFFFLLSIGLFLRYRLSAAPSPNWGNDAGSHPRFSGGFQIRRAAYFAGSLLACALAFFSKEETLMLPVIVVLADLLMVRDGAPPAIQKRLGEYIPFFGVAAVYLWARSEVVGNSGGVASSLLVEPLRRILTVISILCEYVWLALLPVRLDYEPRTPIAQSLFEPRILVSLLCACAAVALVLKYGRKSKPLLFGALWYAAVFIPMSNIVPIYPEAAHSHFFTPIHFLYLPSVGLLWCAGLLGVKMAERGRVSTVDTSGEQPAVSRRTRCVYVKCQGLTPRFLLCCVLFLFALLSMKRNFVWQDEMRLYQYIVRMHPENPRMRLNLGNVYLERGEPEKGLEQLKHAVILAPDVAAYRNGLALAYKEMGWFELAASELEKALSLEPDFVMAYINLTDVYRAQKKCDDAIEAGRRAVELAPSNVAARIHLGFAYKDAGRLGDARMEFEEALQLDAGSAEAHNGLGIIHALQGRADLAKSEWEAALRAEPDMEEALHNLRRLRYMDTR